MKKKFMLLAAVTIGMAIAAYPVMACTGITLVAKDGSRVLARTIEWGGSILESDYVVVPRGYVQQSYTPTGVNGMKFTAKYGNVGLSVQQKEFIVEGINEAGLSAGLFSFPGYGQYDVYDSLYNSSTLSDLQFVPWLLASFATVDEAVAALSEIRVCGLYPDASTVHWRIGDTTGRQVVVEFINGEPKVYENKLGVLTNSPGFEWQMTNLNNYVNIHPGTAGPIKLNGITFSAFGAGSGFFGIPGDVTPPARFVRAAFYQSTAPQYNTARETVDQCFHILNNFDIPIGVEFTPDDVTKGLPSATQWTTATDIKNLVIYYRTVWNSSIRAIDLKSINFDKVKYQSHPLDQTREQPIQMIRIK